LGDLSLDGRDILKGRCEGVASCSGNRNELSDSIKGREFFGELRLTSSITSSDVIFISVPNE
jgi:hypothetical protein